MSIYVIVLYIMSLSLYVKVVHVSCWNENEAVHCTLNDICKISRKYLTSRGLLLISSSADCHPSFGKAHALIVQICNPIRIMIAQTPYLVSLLLFMCISWHFIPVAGNKIRHLLVFVSGVLNLQQDLYSDGSNSVGRHRNAGNDLLLSDDMMEDKLSLDRHLIPDKIKEFRYNSCTS